MEELARIAYEAFTKYQLENFNCSWDRWEDLTDADKKSWGAAVEAVLKFQ